MGVSASQITEEELTYYKELTYLSRKEILHLFNVFKNINSEIISHNKFGRIAFNEIIKKIPEFKHNPFGDRLLKIFSSLDDQKLSFEDFLDMMSVLSVDTPLRKKAEYAFKIYDFDSDGVLSREDLQELIIRLTGSESLNENEINKLVDNLISEADLDKDGFLSFNEFEHIVIKSSADFLSSFHVQL